MNIKIEDKEYTFEQITELASFAIRTLQIINNRNWPLAKNSDAYAFGEILANARKAKLTDK